MLQAVSGSAAALRLRWVAVLSWAAVRGPRWRVMDTYHVWRPNSSGDSHCMVSMIHRIWAPCAMATNDSGLFQFAEFGSSLLAFSKTGLLDVSMEWVTPWVGYGVPDPSPMRQESSKGGCGQPERCGNAMLPVRIGPVWKRRRCGWSQLGRLRRHPEPDWRRDQRGVCALKESLCRELALTQLRE